MDEITLRQLRYFLSLCEAGHYRKAAERAGISQPSLSQQIVRLESALGVDLVERGRRGAVLTPAGREVRSRPARWSTKSKRWCSGPARRGTASVAHCT